MWNTKNQQTKTQINEQVKPNKNKQVGNREWSSGSQRGGGQEGEMDGGSRLSAPVWKLHCGCEDSSVSTETEIQCAHGSPVML